MSAPRDQGTICRCRDCLLLLAALLLPAGCSSRLALESRRPAGEITVDGSVEEWGNERVEIGGETFYVDIRNDADHLYVSLIPGTQMLQMQIMREGLTLWFDADGGRDKEFGIRFPLGSGQGSRAGSGQTSTRPGMDGGFVEDLRAEFEKSLGELEVLGPEQDDCRRMALGAAEGIEVDARLENSLLVYELKLPLSPGEKRPYAVGAAPGNSIGLGFEAPATEMSALRPGMGRGPGGGRGGTNRPPGGGGMGRPPGGGRMGGPRMGSMPEAIEIWAVVQLAGSEPDRATGDRGSDHAVAEDR
jgi:hypothetical protein